MIRTLLLIDGEHYPPVVEAVLPRLEATGRLPVAAFFLGGTEKTGAPPRLPVPVHRGQPAVDIPALVERYQAELVLDLSDEPVLDARSRFDLAGRVLAAGASYAAGGLHLDAPPRPRLTELPTMAVIGTGKRTGKTAVSIELARRWRERGRRPCIVTMGRGGPPEPLVLRGGELTPGIGLLAKLGARGLHATSDYVEDAVFAAVDTVGTRRLGAGPSGVTVDDGFAEGVETALTLDPAMLIYEGSGTAIPPAHADATVLVTRTDTDIELLFGYLGSYRLAIADAVVAIGPRAPSWPGLTVFHGMLRPEATVPVEGRKVGLVTTARPRDGTALATSLQEEGAASVTTVHTLSDRTRLAADLDQLDGIDLVLSEVKAAAADIVLPWAERAGLEVGLIHNRLEMEGGVGRLTDHLQEAAGW